LGIPIKTDKYTKEKTLLKYARLLIDISLDYAFLEYIEFVNDHDVLVRQKVKYKWKPTKCGHCRMFGIQKMSAGRKPRLERNEGLYRD